MITNILRVSLVKRTAAVLCIWCAAFALIAQQRPDALRMYQQGNYDQAISICEQELRTNPKNMDSYVVLCWALVKKGRYSEAEQRALAARMRALGQFVFPHQIEDEPYQGKEEAEHRKAAAGGIPRVGLVAAVPLLRRHAVFYLFLKAFAAVRAKS